jgi:hypothetical protein
MENLWRRDRLENLRVIGMIILKWALNKYDGRVKTRSSGSGQELLANSW